ncbi:MAG TPA: hypothetical protein VLA97_09820 [Nocardioidaceae bacterium]|nr:hypothetical protein [Nocardioidaceae bacterium]
MGTGTGLGLLAAGAVLYWAIEADVPFVDDKPLGVILMVAGAVALVASVVMTLQSTRTRTVVSSRR